MGIDVLVPVLSRPQNAQPLVDSLRATCTHPLVFLCSESDEEEIVACRATGERVEIVNWLPERADYAKKMNHGFRVTEDEFVFLGADDIEFQPGWDSELLKYHCGVVGSNDLSNGQVRRGQFSTHCLVSRRYVTEQGGSADGPGVLLHVGYDHNFVDRELCGLAQSRNEWGFARHARVKHRHPLWNTAPDDDTYRKSLKHFHRDRMMFYRRAHLWNYHGLSEDERKMAGDRRRRVKA